jgi:hypothetical protein
VRGQVRWIKGIGWQRMMDRTWHEDTLASSVAASAAMYRNSTRCGDWLSLQHRQNESLEIFTVADSFPFCSWEEWEILSFLARRPFDPTTRDLRMNRPAGRFTKTKEVAQPRVAVPRFTGHEPLLTTHESPITNHDAPLSSPSPPPPDDPAGSRGPALRGWRRRACRRCGRGSFLRCVRLGLGR